MTAKQYRNRVRKLSQLVPREPGKVRAHLVPVSWCTKHRDVVRPEIAAHKRNIRMSDFQSNLEDSSRITRQSIRTMREVMPEIDPENAEWWRDKADYHESRIVG